jgi:hypothetical protein
MLVAVASFVLHGGAMAGLHQHSQDTTDCATTASGGHVHRVAAHDHAAPVAQHAVHDHGDGVAHHHAEADPAPEEVPSDQQAADEGSACCAGVCAVALIAFGSGTSSVPMASRLVVVLTSQVGSGIDPNGLKRPPRTPSIA